MVESNAGEPSHFSNADYEATGAKVVPKDQLWKESDIVLKVRVFHSRASFITLLT